MNNLKKVIPRYGRILAYGLVVLAAFVANLQAIEANDRLAIESKDRRADIVRSAKAAVFTSCERDNSERAVLFQILSNFRANAEKEGRNLDGFEAAEKLLVKIDCANEVEKLNFDAGV
jgi:hypothetical protein